MQKFGRVGLKEQLQRLVSHVLCSLGEYLGVEAWVRREVRPSDDEGILRRIWYIY